MTPVAHGYDVVLWIEAALHQQGFVPPCIHVHSANPAARQRMLAGVFAIHRHTQNASQCDMVCRCAQDTESLFNKESP